LNKFYCLQFDNEMKDIAKGLKAWQERFDLYKQGGLPATELAKLEKENESLQLRINRGAIWLKNRKKPD
jgi:hypothetical protein